MGIEFDKSASAKEEPKAQDDGCTNFQFFYDTEGKPSTRLELREANTADHAFLSARTEIFNDRMHWQAARIDVAVKHDDGTIAYYEEYPTPLTSPIPLPIFERIAGPVYKYDPSTDKRIGNPLAEDSPEYQEAYKALTMLRQVETPGHVAEGLGRRPICAVPMPEQKDGSDAK